MPSRTILGQAGAPAISTVEFQVPVKFDQTATFSGSTVFQSWLLALPA